MVTARSEIPVVKGNNARDINGAIDAIRQQLRVIAASADLANLRAGQNALNASNGAGSLATLQQQIASLQQQINALSAGGLTPVGTYRADQIITALDPVYATSDGGVSPVDTEDPTAIFAVIGVATSNAALGSNVTVRRSGGMTVTAAGFETGRAVYAQVGGGLTQIPNYATVTIPIGVATGATSMDVRAAWPALRQTPPYGDGYEQFMPVTLAAVLDVLEIVRTLFGQSDGIVVKVGDQFVTREIVTPSGSSISVIDGDGVFGNPTIS